MARPGVSPLSPLLEMPVSGAAEAARLSKVGRRWPAMSGSSSLMYSEVSTLRDLPSTSTWNSSDFKSVTCRPSRSRTVTSIGSTSTPVRNTGACSPGAGAAGAGGVGGVCCVGVWPSSAATVRRTVRFNATSAANGRRLDMDGDLDVQQRRPAPGGGVIASHY